MTGKSVEESKKRCSKFCSCFEGSASEFLLFISIAAKKIQKAIYFCQNFDGLIIIAKPNCNVIFLRSLLFFSASSGERTKGLASAYQKSLFFINPTNGFPAYLFGKNNDFQMKVSYFSLGVCLNLEIGLDKLDVRQLENYLLYHTKTQVAQS